MPTATRHPRIRIVNHGPKNWRTEAEDDCGEWAVTGPPFATKMEALISIPGVALYYFGEVV